MSLQEEIIARFGVKPAIDPDQEIGRRVDFLKAHVKQAGARGLLIAITCETDSAVAAALCKRAADSLTEEQGSTFMVVGVLQPYGEEPELEACYAMAQALGLGHIIETNTEDAVNEMALESEFGLKSMGIHQHLSRGGKERVKARTRRIMQGALAGELNLLVASADQAAKAAAGMSGDETWGGANVRPLASLTGSQVLQLAGILGIPTDAAAKPEAYAGFLGAGVSLEQWSLYLEGGTLPDASLQRLEEQYRRTLHMQAPPPGI
ncbi:MAG: synthetase [Paenibacillaceae bacterium]|nr:synthetase [Paenibacillaceae bacterium]